MFTRRVAALTGALSFAMVSLLAPAAGAATDAEIKAKMLNETEIPAVFGSAKDYDFTAKLLGKTIGICGAPDGTTLVSVPAPGRQYLVDIETTSKKRYAEVMERVYQFPTGAAANAAFQTLYAGLGSCDGTRTAPNGPTGSITDTTITGSPAGGAYEDFYVQVNARFNDTDKRYRSRTAILAVYTQAGDAIIETVAYINPATNITVPQRNALLQLSQELSAKWAPQ